jgi:hypothetical protein
MEPFALTLAALMAPGAVVFVAQPFLRQSKQRRELEPHDQISPRLTLLERRDRALAALKELEFDHRTAKVSDADYRLLLGPLRREAAEALHSLTGTDVRAARSRGVRKYRRERSGAFRSGWAALRDG